MNVDGVFIITLSNQYEKQQKMLDDWKGLDVNFFVVERKNNPKQGCFESHMDVIRMAKEKNMSKILILEDDALPILPMNEIVSRTNNSIEWLDSNDPNWDYFLLGFFPMKSKKTSNKNILNLKCAVLAHSYVVNVKNAKIKKWDGLGQVDEVMFCNAKPTQKSNTYGAYPMMVLQNNEKSSINQFHVIVQDGILHRMGQDNLADISCYVHFINFLVFLILLIFLTPPLCALSAVRDKYPISFLIYLFLYIIFLIIMLCFVFI